MMPWLLTALLIGSLCAAGTGLAWILGVRGRWALLLLSTLIGGIVAACVTVAGAGLLGAGVPGSAIFRGIAVGAGIGSAVWALIDLTLQG